MTTKIVRGDGVTELTGIKSCVFTERVNAEENLRPGCVSSASIEVEVYGSQINAISAGEELTYYQVDSNGNETLIGVFYARPSIPTKNTYKFTAYDAVSKLEVDFSERLYSISASFPMTVKDIVDEACNVAGVTLASSSWPLSTQTVNEFYSDGVTCRQILAWAAEIACCFVHCDTSGELVFDWYATKSGYKVYPTSGSGGGATYVPYKQDGLNYENYNVDPIQFVAVRPIDTDGVAYIYPSTFVDIGASDPNADGNVVLTDISAADDGNGNITVSSSINITDDGHGNLTITNGGTGSGNTLVIFDNLLLCDATTATMTAVAQNLYNRMAIVGAYRPATIELFPFDNPFRAGDIVVVEDIQGVTFNTIVMEMSVSHAVAQAMSTGKKQQEDVPVNGQSRLARLGENIVRIKNLVVDSLTAITARINDLFAENILCTGKFEVNNGVYYLTQTTDGFVFGSLLENADPYSPSTEIVANATDGVEITTESTNIKLRAKLGGIQLVTDNFERTSVTGGLEADYIWMGGNTVVAHRGKTVTNNTSINGNISLGLQSSIVQPCEVIYVRRTDSTSICIPYYDTTNDTWMAHIMSTTGNAVTSTSVSLQVGYYMKTNPSPN